MLYVNQVKVTKRNFPDNSQLLMGDTFCDHVKNGCNSITWLYANDEELVTLIYLVNYIREVAPKSRLILNMPYVPNARMDRVKSYNEVFTLKYFAKTINSLGFDNVCVFDPHSDVSCALFNNLRILDYNLLMDKVIFYNDNVPFSSYVFFPDSGAMKRYSKYFAKNTPIIYGEKQRDWNTGEITGLEVHSQNGDSLRLDGQSVLMVDDIISYGGTLFHSAKKLKELGAKHIEICCSHLENSFFDEKGTLRQLLDDGTVETIYTTNSIYVDRNQDNIKVLVDFVNY